MIRKTTPPNLIDGSSYPTVTAHMQALIAHWEDSDDRRCIFLDCYCSMTGNTLDALTQNRFHDREWVNRLLHRFAHYYFEALAAYEQPEGQTPAVWQLTYDAGRRDELSVLQHLLLGVNAHINYDLALALRDLLAPEWATLSPDEVRRRYEDHLLVNQIIAETVDTVQDEVVERYAPALDLVDKLLGPVDEWATARVIGKWRDEVWENALALLAAENEQAEIQIREKLEQRSLQLARIFLFE